MKNILKRMAMIMLIIASALNFSCEKDSVSSGSSGGAQPGEIQYLPYTQSFKTKFGTYTTKNVIGNQAWEINYSAATMRGYEHEGNVYESFKNEDWLISSPVSVTGVGHAKMVITYAGLHFQGITNNVTIWASTDYKYDDMPSMATWTRIPVALYETDECCTPTTFTEISLPRRWMRN